MILFKTAATCLNWISCDIIKKKKVQVFCDIKKIAGTCVNSICCVIIKKTANARLKVDIKKETPYVSEFGILW